MNASSLAPCLTVDATVRAAGPDGFDVEADTSSRCAGCAGTCLWSWRREAWAARVRSDLPLGVGDRVRVSLPADQLLASTLLLHGLPLAALLAGGTAGAIATQSDVGCLVGAVAAVAAVLCFAPRLRQRVERLTAERVIVEPVGAERR